MVSHVTKPHPAELGSPIGTYRRKRVGMVSYLKLSSGLGRWIVMIHFPSGNPRGYHNAATRYAFYHPTNSVSCASVEQLPPSQVIISAPTVRTQCLLRDRKFPLFFYYLHGRFENPKGKFATRISSEQNSPLKFFQHLPWIVIT